MLKLSQTSISAFTLSMLLFAGVACSDDSSTDDDSEASDDDSEASDDDSEAADDDGEAADDDGEAADDDGEAAGDDDIDCTSVSTNVEEVVCAAEAFMDTLDDTELESVSYEFTDSVSKTRWSNLPPIGPQNAVVDRNGLTYGELSDESLDAVKTLAAAVLSDDGYTEFEGFLAGDDYLGTLDDSGLFGSENYIVAIFGTPSTTGDWMIQLGGHHMAYNIVYQSGTASPTPNFVGVEPRGEFTVNGESYAPMEGDGDAFVALFDSLSEDELSDAYLSGQSFSDVLLGPVEYETGTLDDVEYPTGDDRGGILASDLSDEQQELITAVIAEWVEDYDESIAEPLMEAYTSEAAYEDTRIAWAGTESAGPDVDVSGTYMRIDGPRLWLEIAVQNGFVLTDETHYHTQYRDKDDDYGGSL